MLIELTDSERWFYVGKTGSGKSTLIRHHLKALYERGLQVVIIDGPDHSWPIDETADEGTLKHPLITRAYKPNIKCQMFQPSPPGWADADLMRFVQQVFNHGYCVVVFDELFGILDATHLPSVILQLWSQGRKHHIAVHAASQRPRRIPEIVMSQAEQWAVFRLRNIKDRQAVGEWIDKPDLVDDQSLPMYYWYYYNDASGDAVLMQPIEEDA